MIANTRRLEKHDLCFNLQISCPCEETLFMVGPGQEERENQSCVDTRPLLKRIVLLSKKKCTIE
jgi:hypothetical protein